MTCFSQFSTFSSKQIHKMHKITCYHYDMRKISTKNFWSQGTLLGSPGPGSQADLILGFSRFQILVIWGPYGGPVLVACQGHSKTPKFFPRWCVISHSKHCTRYVVDPFLCVKSRKEIQNYNRSYSIWKMMYVDNFSLFFPS